MDGGAGVFGNWIKIVARPSIVEARLAPIPDINI